MIVGVTSERGKSGQHGVSGAPEDFTIDNVWIIHTQTGTWLSKGENGSIRNSRFRNTTADGLNLNSASHDIVVENNNSRGTGDDGLAVFSSSDHAGVLGPCHDIFVHNNTVEAPWNGNCIGVYGGNNIRVEDNLVRSSVRDAGVAVTTGFASWPGNRITVKKNDIVDCGGIHWKQEWGGMFIYTPGKDLTSLDVINNRIIDPTFSGIKIQGGSGTGCVNAKILDNEITSSGGVAILVTPSAKGTLSIATNAVNGGIVLLKNLAPATNVKLESDVQYP
jgi:hypothetical protein